MYNRDVLGRWNAHAIVAALVAGCGFEHGAVSADTRVPVDAPLDVVVDSPVYVGQVGLDGFSDGEAWSTTTFTRNHTVGFQPMRLMVVGVTLTSATTSVASLTYGGAPLTRVGVQNAGQGHVEIWKLENPSSGAAPVTVTLTDSLATMTIGIGSYFNVHPTIPLSPLMTAVGASGAPTTTIASGPGQIVESVVIWHQSNTTLTTSDQVQWERVLGDQIGAGSTTAGAAVVSPTFTVANGANAPWAIVAFSVHPGG